MGDNTAIPGIHTSDLMTVRGGGGGGGGGGLRPDEFGGGGQCPERITAHELRDFASS